MTIGIDLGTTNSCAAYINENGEAVVLPEEHGNTIASAISNINGQCIVGKYARERALKSIGETVVSAKRLIGIPYYEAQSIASKYNMDVRRGKNDEPVIAISSGVYTIPQISAKVLTAIKRHAEKTLNTIVDGAVITVPAYFNERQRAATEKAGKLAGLKVEAIISEPTAAALAYKKDGLIAVYDLGGGTFDISIVKKDGKRTETIATGGELFLGGDDIDEAIMRKLIKTFESKTNTTVINADKTPVSEKAAIIMQRIRNVSEKLKRNLSEVWYNPSTLEVSDVVRNIDEDNDFTFTLRKSELMKILDPFINRTLKCCQNALNEANLTIKDLSAVILVGGSTKAPYIREKIGEFFQQKPDTSLNPDEAVAIGAALSIPLNTTNAFVDVTPLSLFIKTFKGYCEIIKRHTQLPVTAKGLFTTSKNMQTSINFVVCQGSEKNNVPLGTLVFDEIKPQKAGMAQIEVEFSINKSGLMKIKATNKDTNFVREVKIIRNF